MKVQQSLALVITVMLTCVACSGSSGSSEVNHRPPASSGVGETDSIQNGSEERSSPNIKSSSVTDVSDPFESLDMDVNAITSEDIVLQPKLTDVPAIEEQPQSSALPSNSPSDDVDIDVMTGVSLDPVPEEFSDPSDVDANAFTAEELEPQPADAPALLPEPVDTNAFTGVQLEPQPDSASFAPTLIELMPELEPTEAVFVDIADDEVLQNYSETVE